MDEILALENRRIEAELTAEEQALTRRRPGMDPAAFREFLRYLYTDAVPDDVLEAMPGHLLDLADKYGVETIKTLPARKI